MNNDCVICLENINKDNLIKLNCKHMFHKDCILTLIKKRNRKCPLCRHRITWTINFIETNNHKIKSKKRKFHLI